MLRSLQATLFAPIGVRLSECAGRGSRRAKRSGNEEWNDEHDQSYLFAPRRSGRRPGKMASRPNSKRR